MLKKVKKKLNHSGGFTLAETLMTVLLMTIVLSAVTGGMAVARDAYREMSRKADAQTLLATTVSALTEDLSDAKDFETISDTSGGLAPVSFKTPSRGYRIVYRYTGDGSSADKKGIYVVPVLSGKLKREIEVPLVTQKTSTLDLYSRIEEFRAAGKGGDADYSVVKVTVSVYSRMVSSTEPVEKGVVYIHTAA